MDRLDQLRPRASAREARRRDEEQGRELQPAREGTGARIRYKKVSDETGEEVAADKIKRGYEISKGRYVMIEPDELEALRPKGSHAIEIEEFVDLDEIDPLYFEQPYYLVPDKRGEKPYKLLVDAMK